MRVLTDEGGRCSPTDTDHIEIVSILSAESLVSVAKTSLTPESGRRYGSSRRCSLNQQGIESVSQKDHGYDNSAYSYGSSSHEPSERSRTTTPSVLTIDIACIGHQDGLKMNGTCGGYNADQDVTGERCDVPIQQQLVDLSSHMDKAYGMLPEVPMSDKVVKRLRSRCTCSLSCLITLVTSLLPVISWLPQYKMEYLMPDAIAGFTIAILHIPQGMAYGILASVQAENGLYVSFFPVLMYFFLGTSRHISIGTFAVVSLMLSSTANSMGAVESRSTSPIHGNDTNSTSFGQQHTLWPPTNLEVLTSMAIAVGFWQLFMGIFQLGALSVILSDQLVSGFSTGAACHVATSQMKDLFGISIGTYTGPLKLVYMYIDIFNNLVYSNVATIIVATVAILFLAVIKEQVNDRFKTKLKMPIPIDLIVVILATVVSYFGDFNRTYNVTVMGHIPTGLPSPVPPRMDLLPYLITDSFAVAIVAFAISLSMAKIFSRKHKYPICANQELIALGCSNVFSSIFACFPCSASLSRSLVQERAGGKTQVAGVISCGLLLIVLLALAPMFYSLPKCILSAVILVALKGMFLQVKDFLKAWRISKFDALIWLVTVLSVVLLDVQYGLLAGVLFSLLTVIIRTVIPSRTFLGNIPESDIYLDMKRYSQAQQVKGVRIFHFESALYFINRELFKTSLLKHIPLITSKSDEDETEETKNSKEEIIHYIIIDCSSFSYIDMSGLDTLLEIMKEYKEVGITVYLAACSISMYDIMQRASFFKMVPYEPSTFPTIHDAVQFCSLSVNN